MYVTMSDSETPDAEPVEKERCATPTISARVYKTNNHTFKTANEFYNHLKKTKNTCKASHGWWRLLSLKWTDDAVICLLFSKNRARLSRERAEPMIFLNEHGWQADFTEEDVLDLS